MARKQHRPTPTMQHCLEPANRHCFGLDIIALVGSLCYVKHQSIPEIHKQLFRCEGKLVHTSETLQFWLIQGYLKRCRTLCH